MAENTQIEWATHTFNPWRGCRKVSPACQNCYAETRANRFGEDFAGQRVLLSDAGWKKPLKWNRDADIERRVFEAVASEGQMRRQDIYSHGDLEEYGEVALHNALDELEGRGLVSESEDTFAAAGRYQRPRVFCASLADVFEDFDGPLTCHRTGEGLAINDNGHIWPPGWPSMSDGDDWGIREYTMSDARSRLFDLIDATPHLDWLLLTKRPENILSMWPMTPGVPISCRDGWERPTELMIRPNVWLGCTVENQEQLDKRWFALQECRDYSPVLFWSAEPLLGQIEFPSGPCPDWVITGGESGPNARQQNIKWFTDLGRQCIAANVAWYHKQHGCRPYYCSETHDASMLTPNRKVRCYGDSCCPQPQVTGKGNDPAEWFGDIWRRELPEVTS